ncbi:hypothetical protein [Desulfonatronum sp. SC1]|uniref:hypothetical protein n=1 Tax=Desulfonatronum sp. SC1 TaxID=2109626 RepID=UPI0011B1E670|nr:hypothetical protein [Desulfonatronum sp. SC1]
MKSLQPAGTLAFMAASLYVLCLATIAMLRSETGFWRWTGSANGAHVFSGLCPSLGAKNAKNTWHGFKHTLKKDAWPPLPCGMIRALGTGMHIFPTT